MNNLFHTLVLSWMPDGILQSLKKWHYVRAVSRFYESDFDVVRLLLKPGDSAIDIGANAGWYTKLFSDLVGPEGIVYSIEPVPPTYEILSNTITKLNLDNVRHHNCALSNKPGITTMAIPQYSTGGENYYCSLIIDKTVGSDLRTFKVKTRTLDHLMSGVDKSINLVKCDVEGHEHQVLEGSTEFLEKSDAAWLIEISGNPDKENTSASKVFKLFYNHGYNTYLYRDGKLEIRKHGDKSVNYFMLKPIHLTSLPSGLSDS